MNEEIFSDGIAEISFEHGVFRLNLVSISPTKRDENNKPTLMFRQRIIMPVEGFLRSFASMERVVKKLIEEGHIKRNQPENGQEELQATTQTPPSFS